jgi:hypothetical protein
VSERDRVNATTLELSLRVLQYGRNWKKSSITAAFVCHTCAPSKAMQALVALHQSFTTQPTTQCPVLSLEAEAQMQTLTDSVIYKMFMNFFHVTYTLRRQC